MSADFDSLQKRLGYRFRKPELLKLALTHPSVMHEEGAVAPHNQRLEFLGDAVLQLVLTAELYERFPVLGEGPLTKARAQLVNRRSLAELARRANLGQHLIVSRGEDLHGGRHRASALADAFEAVIGAIYLDAGFGEAHQFVLNMMRLDLGELDRAPTLHNPKGELQELLQSWSAEAPRYQVAAVTGPDHDRLFECAVYHQGVELARGTGKSKKEAEAKAALAAFEQQRLARQTAPAPGATTPASPGLGSPTTSPTASEAPAP